MYPITLLSSHLDDCTFRIAALPLLLSMVYVAYACLRPKDTEDPAPPP